MVSSTEILSTLNQEEQKAAADYITYRRDIAVRGLSPVTAAKKGITPKILSNYESYKDFIDFLLKPEMLVALKKADPLLAAKLRGQKAKGEMLSTEGKPWSSSEVAEYLGVAINTVSKQRRNNKLLGLHCGSQGFRFPSWQFKSHEVLPGLNQVIAVLNINLVPDWDKLRFFITSDFRLSDKTPLSCLRSGEIENVVKAAKSYGVQSAS